MKVHPADISAYIGYGATGGFGGCFALLGFIFPKQQAEFNAAAVATVAVCTSIAGAIRVKANPTPPIGQQAVLTTATPPTAESLTTPSENAESGRA